MDPFSVKSTISTARGDYSFFSLPKLFSQGIGRSDKLPVSIRVLLENVLRNLDGKSMSEQDVKNLANWDPSSYQAVEVNFLPARVVLQDFTGVPAVVDLAALRSAMQRMGGDPSKINPIVPVDLVIDHSVQVDVFGRLDAISLNSKLEFERNAERYEFLHWGQKAFENFKVVPPATGIVHQVNLEFLADAVQFAEINGEKMALFDTLVGTDSHTTMINGLGVLGGVSEASKLKRVCLGSLSPWSCHRLSVSSLPVSSPKEQPLQTWFWWSPKCSARKAWLANL